MSDLQLLARLKADAEMQKRISAVPTEIKAIQHELSAKGLLRSGVMLKRVLAACQLMVEAQRGTIVSEYQWAIGQALLASQSWVDRLVSEASESLRPLHSVSENHIRKACDLAGTPELAARLLADLQATEIAAKNDIALALRSSFAERRRGLLRSLASLLPRLLSRLFRGGGA